MALELPGAKAFNKNAAIFRRGQKRELFGDGEEEEGQLDERQELEEKLGDLLEVWAASRVGRELAAAIWRPQLQLAEVVLQRGKLFSHMGFTQGKKLYLFIEEATYLIDRANLLLFLDHGQGRQRLLSLQESHELMLACGLRIDMYLVYCKLMRAGYIVQRHPSRWVIKPSEHPQSIWPKWYPQQQPQPEQAEGAIANSVAVETLAPPPAAAAQQAQQQQQGDRHWWPAVPAQQQQQQQQPGAVGWPPQLPPAFQESLPKCDVAPPEAVGKVARYPHMQPLQSIRLQDLAQPRPDLLDLDVFAPSSKFSRKAAGTPAFLLGVLPCTYPPSLEDMVGADLAGDGVPVRFATVEQGDVHFYGVPAVKLRNIL